MAASAEEMTNQIKLLNNAIINLEAKFVTAKSANETLHTRLVNVEQLGAKGGGKGAPWKRTVDHNILLP